MAGSQGISLQAVPFYIFLPKLHFFTVTDVINTIFNWCLKICIVHSSISLVRKYKSFFFFLQFPFFNISKQSNRLSFVDCAVVDDSVHVTGREMPINIHL